MRELFGNRFHLRNAPQVSTCSRVCFTLLFLFFPCNVACSAKDAWLLCSVFGWVPSGRDVLKFDVSNL